MTSRQPIRGLWIPLLLILRGAFLLSTAPSAAGPRDSLVVSTSWLSDHLKDPNLVLIQVGQNDKKRYLAEHIPGAQYVALEELAAPMDHANMKPGDLMLELPTDAALRETLQKHGVTEQSAIVLYFGKDEVSETTRVILTLDHAGFGARTSLLQGGLAAWTRDGHPTTTDVPTARTSTIGALKPKTATVDAAFVQANTGKSGIALVDARDRAAYDGLSDGGPNPRAGHIPGALSVPFQALYDEKYELRSAAELEAVFAAAGVKPGDKIVGYCWIGQYATAMLFAARTLGHDVLLYDGSFEDWTARKLPLESVKK